VCFQSHVCIRRLWLIAEVAGVSQIVRECDGLFWCFTGSGLRRRFCRHVFPPLSREGAEEWDMQYRDRFDPCKNQDVLIVFYLCTRVNLSLALEEYDWSRGSYLLYSILHPRLSISPLY